ncbi:MAG: hypothetical protein U0R72_19385 [Nakamurella multipartita]
MRRIFLIGTPALWWISLFVLICAVEGDRGSAGLAVRGGPGRLRRRLPALVHQPDRQMYFFYATPLAPFLVIGTLVLGDILADAAPASNAG